MSQAVFVAPLTPSRIKYDLLILRLVVGIVFLVHGAQKVFEQSIPGVAQYSAPLVSYLELGGGILLILGLLTSVVALLFATDMLGAIFLVHLPNGFSILNGGYEFVLTLLAASVALALTGPGALALDDMLFKRNRSRS